jgi:ESF2/ABP1 family protein
MELSQSKVEQQDYLRNVELARVLEKRAERRKSKEKMGEAGVTTTRKRPAPEGGERGRKKKQNERTTTTEGVLDAVLSKIF